MLYIPERLQVDWIKIIVPLSIVNAVQALSSINLWFVPIPVQLEAVNDDRDNPILPGAEGQACASRTTVRAERKTQTIRINGNIGSLVL